MPHKKLLFILLTILASFMAVFLLSKIFPEIFLKKEIIASSLVIIFMLINITYNAFREGRVKKLCMQLLGWVGIVFSIIILYTFRPEIDYLATRVLSSIIPSYGLSYKPGEIIISRSIDGHFYIKVMINKTPIKFMIDTGASDVALTQEDAKKLGFDIAKLRYTKTYSTANGLASAAPVKLDRFIIGDKEFTSVQAHVPQGKNDVSLLGMSIISRFKSFRIDKDLLILTY